MPTKPDAPLAADGPQFAKIRPDILQGIREAEVDFRNAMKEMIDRFPAHLTGDLEPIVSEVPARFISGLFPFFRDLSEMLDSAEMLKKYLLKKVNDQARPN